MQLDQQVQQNTADIDALNRIHENATRATADGTELIPVSVPDVTGIDGHKEYKMNVSTLIKSPCAEKTDDYTLANVNQNGDITFRGDNLTLTIPVDLTWSNCSTCRVRSYGTGFSITAEMGVTLKVPQTLTSVENSIYDIKKTANNEYSVVQMGTASGGGGAVDSVNGETGVVVLDADDIDDTSTTHKFATSAELAQIATNQSDIADKQDDLSGLTVTNKATPVGADKVLIQDSEDSDNLKEVNFSDFGGGGGSSAPTAKTGTSIQFNAPAVYNEVSPLAGSTTLTLNETSAISTTVRVDNDGTQRFDFEVSWIQKIKNVSGEFIEDVINKYWIFRSPQGDYDINIVADARTQLTTPTVSAEATDSDTNEITIVEDTDVAYYTVLTSMTNDVGTASAVSGYNGTDLVFDHDVTGAGAGTHFYWVTAHSVYYRDSEYGTTNVANGFDFSGNLVAYYKYDNDVTDSSGNGHHGTAGAGTDYNTGTAQIGDCVLFSGGTDRYNQIANHADFSFVSQAFTICIPIYYGTKTGLQHIFGKFGGDGNREWILYSDGTDLVFGLFNASNPYTGIKISYPLSSISTGQWYHIVVQHTGSTDENDFTMHVDGVSVGTVGTDGGTYTGQTAGTSPIVHGGSASDPAVSHHSGRGDELYIWRKNHTETEVAEMYRRFDNGETLV